MSDLPRVHLRRHHEPAAILERLRTGEWLRVREGAFVDDAELGADPHLRRRRLALAHVIAVAARTRTTFAFSHETAALLWGLPTVGAGPSAHLTQRTRPGAHHAADVKRHSTHLPDEHLTTIAGLPVTTLARTAADCVAHRPGASGLALADAAARAGVALGEVLAIAAARRGHARVRAVLSWVDDGAESAGESLARAALLRLGLPAPATQVAVATEDGVVWSDLGWEQWRVLVEYDGLVKYEDGGLQALMREKRREDALRDRGYRVLRLTADDLRDDHRLLRRLTQVLPAAAFRDLRPRPVLSVRHPRDVRR